MIQPNGPIALGSNALRATVNAQGGFPWDRAAYLLHSKYCLNTEHRYRVG